MCHVCGHDTVLGPLQLPPHALHKLAAQLQDYISSLLDKCYLAQSQTHYTTDSPYPQPYKGDTKATRKAWRQKMKAGQVVRGEGKWLLYGHLILIVPNAGLVIGNYAMQSCYRTKPSHLQKFIRNRWSGWNQAELFKISQVALQLLSSNSALPMPPPATAVSPSAAPPASLCASFASLPNSRPLSAPIAPETMDLRRDEVRRNQEELQTFSEPSDVRSRWSAQIRSRLEPRLLPAMDELNRFRGLVGEHRPRTIFEQSLQVMDHMFGDDWLGQIAPIGTETSVNGLYGDVPVKECMVRYATMVEVEASEFKLDKPVVVPCYRQPCADTSQKVAHALLARTSASTTIDIQDTSRETSEREVRTVQLSDAMIRLASKQLWNLETPNAISRSAEKLCGISEPINYLSIGDINILPEPELFHTERRFNIVRDAHTRLEQRESVAKPVQKIQSRESPWADMESCRIFTLIGEALSWSKPHVDILGGTWVINLKGLKIWWVCIPNAQELEEFGKYGLNWMPSGISKPRIARISHAS